MNQLMVWVLMSFTHPGATPDTHAGKFLGVYESKAACEHMLAALSDPAHKLPTAKPAFMLCSEERVQK